MMLGNYLLIALRRLVRERTYVLINVLSLALGIASFLIIALYIRSELTYDQHHVKHQRIYRVVARFQKDGGADNFATSQVGIGPLLTRDYPQLGKYVRFRPWAENVLKYENNQRQWERIYLADPTVFEIFTHTILYGDARAAFREPYSIAISETVARHYFGATNPIGRNLSSGSRSYKVTLVFADLPENTHLRYDVLLPMSLMEVFSPGYTTNVTGALWGVHVFTYLLVTPDFRREDFPAIAAAYFEKYMAERGAQLKMTFRADLQPLSDTHFGEKLLGDVLTGNILYVYGFAAVAIFILVVACINYVNLATARASRRAKEVGMRKILGAHRWQLIAQFLGESLAVTAVALLIAWILIELAVALTPIGTLMGKEYLLAVRSQPSIWIAVLGLGLGVALLAGSYPALYLSNISELAALTDVKRSWKSGVSLRQVLVLAQLSISIGVVTCTWLMVAQLRYLDQRPLGFDTQNRLIVTLRGFDVVRQLKTIKSELRKERNIIDVTAVGSVPGTGNAVNIIPTENNAGVLQPVDLHRIMVGRNFVESMRLELLEGRGFSEEIASDANEAALVNESFVRKMEWHDALGKRFRLGSDVARVVGVVKDFHYASLHNAIGPLLILPVDENLGTLPESQRPFATLSIIVVMSGDTLADTMERVQSVIARFDPNFYFEPVFLQERLRQLYESESRLMKLTGIFAAISIFISLIGLYGLTAFTTEQRTKEIGIRRVLGASIAEIIGMFSRYLLGLVIVAAIPASIVSYYVMRIWLDRFAYHTGVDPWVFIVSTLLVAGVALATAVWQAAKAARANPVDALRYE